VNRRIAPPGWFATDMTGSRVLGPEDQRATHAGHPHAPDRAARGDRAPAVYLASDASALHDRSESLLDGAIPPGSLSAMKAARSPWPRDLRVQAVARPEPDGRRGARPGGRWRSLWHRPPHLERQALGRYPRVMGHELVGRSLESGERVVVEPNFSCGACPLCREGNGTSASPHGRGDRRDGGFAELVRVPSRCCWPAPGPAADEELRSPSRSPSS